MEEESDPSGYLLKNILSDLGFIENIEYKKTFLDKILIKKGKPTFYVAKNDIKINMETYEWFDKNKSLGKLFNENIENKQNVINVIKQMI